MAAARQYVLVENKSHDIFLKKLNKNFLNKDSYLCFVWLHMCSKEEYAVTWPISALNLIGYLYMQLSDLCSQICNYMCKLYAEMNTDGWKTSLEAGLFIPTKVHTFKSLFQAICRL